MHNERRKLYIDAYGKETDRIKVLGTTLTPEAIQALVLQTVGDALAAPPIQPEPPGFDPPHEMPADAGFLMPEQLPEVMGEMPPTLPDQELPYGPA